MRVLIHLIPMALAISLGVAIAAVPQAAQPAKAADTATLYVNAIIHTGNGDKPLEKAYLLVKGGKIEDVGVGKPDMPDVEVIDLAGAVVIPGLVAREEK